LRETMLMRRYCQQWNYIVNELPAQECSGYPVGIPGLCGDRMVEVEDRDISKGHLSYRSLLQGGASAMFIIEFFRVRDTDQAHATLGRVEHDTTNLEAAKVRARSLFETLEMPQKPDALRVIDERGEEVFVWSPKGHRT